MRTRKIIENYVGTKPYFSVNNYLKTGSLFGWDFIFDTLPKKLLPFDYETYANYPGELHVGTTDIKTGEAVWHYDKRAEIAFNSVIASASLPFLAPIVNIDNRPLLDGAIVSPIPIDKAIEAGYKKFVVVLTRNEGYRKKGSVPKLLLKAWYGQYPKLWEAMQNRPKLYNEQLERIEQMERDGNLIIIRPEKPLEIARLSIKPDKLLELHDHGVECGLAAIEKIIELNNN
jgi:predicted patatin/cPLA2 family phospholipase